MKHPAWCDEDDCEYGWHRFSAQYDNGGLARIEVRLCQNVETDEFELDLSDNGNANGYNTVSDIKSIEYEISELTKFRNNLDTIIKALSGVNKKKGS